MEQNRYPKPDVTYVTDKPVVVSNPTGANLPLRLVHSNRKVATTVRRGLGRWSDIGHSRRGNIVKSKCLRHGVIHAVIYPKRGTGVMLVPDEFLHSKDSSHDWNAMVEDLQQRGFTLAGTLEDHPVLVGNVECVQLRSLE